MNSMPIIIGGTGGSGTRVIAEILIRSGVYLGQDLNRSKDNLLFTYLFKHPKRFANDTNRVNPKYRKLFALHEKLLLGYSPNKIREIGILFRAGWAHAFNWYNWKWVMKRWNRIARSKPVTPAIWGWKEPHSMFFLHDMQAYHSDAKFILVLRNGLDMTYSSTDQQFRHWGTGFQIDPSDLGPRNRFEFWYQSNRQAITTAMTIFGENFLMIRFEDLFLRREHTMSELFEFVGLDVGKISSEIWKIPQQPESYNRYRHFATAWIDLEVTQKLAEIGYEQ